ALGALHERLGLPITVAEMATVTRGSATAAIMDALRLRSDGDSGTDALVEFLSGMPHLLVMDNCEHLLDELGRAVATIARRARGVRVLATSRRRLGITGEFQLPLAPLRLPDPGATTGNEGSAAAVQMFGDRLRRLQPSFTL